MRPKQQQKARLDDLFRARLDRIINMKHALVVLADKIDWAWLDEERAGFFSDDGRPAEPVRFMIGMFLLKHTYALSDEEVWERWVHDPYFQYFTGEAFFRHELPHARSGLSPSGRARRQATGASVSAAIWTFCCRKPCASRTTPGR